MTSHFTRVLLVLLFIVLGKCKCTPKLSLCAWCRLSKLFIVCPCVKRFVMSPSGVRGWGSPWRRCMEHKSLLKPGRAGLMGLHSLQKDQKVLNTYRLITQVEQSNTENHQKQTVKRWWGNVLESWCSDKGSWYLEDGGKVLIERGFEVKKHKTWNLRWNTCSSVTRSLQEPMGKNP